MRAYLVAGEPRCLPCTSNPDARDCFSDELDECGVCQSNCEDMPILFRPRGKSTHCCSCGACLGHRERSCCVDLN